ncbi:MAG: adenylate/guanylate cyclase domain-containing protein [Rhodospirillales bacterium]
MDPSPRTYPPTVTLRARSARGQSLAPFAQTPEEVESWLLQGAAGTDDLLALFEEFVWRLVAIGLPLDRASLHVGTLHPQLLGFAWNWNIADGLCDEVQVAAEALQNDAFLRSPLAVVFRTGEPLRIDPALAEAAERFSLVPDLRALGITEYVALPLGGRGYHNVTTVATRRAGGFAPEQFHTIECLLRLLSLHVERHIALRIAANVLRTYLGADAGRQVLEGTIRRGEGRRIAAVIWASDLRGFTDLSDRLDPPAMLAVLNAYFAAMVGTVQENGGEVLKFMGDGLLAVFPLDRTYGGRSAPEMAVTAALAAQEAVADLCRIPPPEIAGLDGWRPLRSGIGLHEGEVFFGNIGAPERLDFTVIGQAVNTASRVEGLTKVLGRPILMTAAVARGLADPPENLGLHVLRGLAEPVEIFAPLPNVPADAS